MSIGVSINVKKMFFDRPKVVKALKSTNRRILSKTGAFIRTSARGSIKTRSYESTSSPGSPPYDHTGFALQRINRQRKKAGLQRIKRSQGSFNQGLRAILFAYEPSTESVIVGPVKFGGSGRTVPSVLEYGGTTTNWKKETMRVQKRPFMEPAMKKELPSLPAKWRSSLRA
jgi:hypothetical protein